MKRLIKALFKASLDTLFIIFGASLLLVYPIQTIIGFVFVVSVIGAYRETL